MATGVGVVSDQWLVSYQQEERLGQQERESSRVTQDRVIRVVKMSCDSQVVGRSLLHPSLSSGSLRAVLGAARGERGLLHMWVLCPVLSYFMLNGTMFSTVHKRGHVYTPHISKYSGCPSLQRLATHRSSHDAGDPGMGLSILVLGLGGGEDRERDVVMFPGSRCGRDGSTSSLSEALNSGPIDNMPQGVGCCAGQPCCPSSL